MDSVHGTRTLGMALSPGSMDSGSGRVLVLWAVSIEPEHWVWHSSLVQWTVVQAVFWFQGQCPLNQNTRYGALPRFNG